VRLGDRLRVRQQVSWSVFLRDWEPGESRTEVTPQPVQNGACRVVIRCEGAARCVYLGHGLPERRFHLLSVHAAYLLIIQYLHILHALCSLCNTSGNVIKTSSCHSLASPNWHSRAWFFLSQRWEVTTLSPQEHSVRVAAEPVRCLLSSKLESARESLTTTERGRRVRCPLPLSQSHLISYSLLLAGLELLNSRTVTSPSVQEALASILKTAPTIQCSLSDSMVRPWVRNGINRLSLPMPQVKTEWWYYLTTGRPSLSLREVDTTELNPFGFHPHHLWRSLRMHLASKSKNHRANHQI
jgi:hypothetical protein